MPENPYQAPENLPPQGQWQPEAGHKPAATALDAIIPTNPLAALSCYSGIFSVVCCFVGILLGPLAIATGVIALKKSRFSESEYGATTSKIRMWIGIVTGVVGTLLGIAVIVISVLNAFAGR
jgi:hypothetical protein